MGNIIKSWFDYFSGIEECKIFIAGLDAAGKTTILYKLKLGDEPIRTIPTIGFNVESVLLKNIHMNLWDVGGRDKIFPLYTHYFVNLDAFVIVVDSNDSERFVDVKEKVLHFLHDDEKLKDVVVLIFANKQDMKGAASTSEIVEKLNLTEIKQKWKIQPCSAIKDEGLYEGFCWIADEIKKKKQNPTEK
eukprot:gene5766-9587_t